MRLALASLLLATGCLHQDSTDAPGDAPDAAPEYADHDGRAALPTSGPVIAPGLAPPDDAPAGSDARATPARPSLQLGRVLGHDGRDGAPRVLAEPPHRPELAPALALGDDAPTTMRVDGTYTVRSQIELTVEALLPEPAAALVGTLRDFSQQPAHTLITLADEAGVPAVGTLRAVLPDALEARLEGWIDEEIAGLTLGGVAVPELAASLEAYAETALTQVGIESTLTLDGGTARHRLTGLDLAPAGLDVQLALGGLPDEVVSATAAVTADGATLAVAEHAFALPYGQYVWDALEVRFLAEHGMGVRAALGAAVRCPVVAARVANKCVFGVCVGHQAELTSLCERGLDEVVDKARAKLASFRFDALRLVAGSATLVDDDADQVADALADGAWTAELDAGRGPRSVPATFTATR